jgi:hypothetical protein
LHRLITAYVPHRTEPLCCVLHHGITLSAYLTSAAVLCYTHGKAENAGFFKSLGRFHAGTSQMLQLERGEETCNRSEAVLP